MLASSHAQFDTRVQHLNHQLDLALTTELASKTEQAQLFLHRGQVYTEALDWELARQDFQRAMDITDDLNIRLNIWFYMWRMRLQSGMPSEAHKLLSKVIKLDPSYQAARLNLARTFIALEQYNAAVDEMDIFISSLSRPTPDQFIERANMAMLIDEEGSRLAVEGLNDAVEQLGPIVTIVDLLVESHLAQGEWQAAINAIDMLAERVKSLPRWQLKLGDIYQQQKRFLEAQTAYKKGLMTLNNQPAHRRATVASKEMQKRLESKLIE